MATRMTSIKAIELMVFLASVSIELIEEVVNPIEIEPYFSPSLSIG